MTDAEIVARLRDSVKGCPFPNVYTEMNTGADLIERLQSELTAERERAERNEKDAERLRDILVGKAGQWEFRLSHDSLHIKKSIPDVQIDHSRDPSELVSLVAVAMFNEIKAAIDAAIDVAKGEP